VSIFNGHSPHTSNDSTKKTVATIMALRWDKIAKTATCGFTKTNGTNHGNPTTPSNASPSNCPKKIVQKSGKVQKAIIAL
jgi:hypothetical protein